MRCRGRCACNSSGLIVKVGSEDFFLFVELTHEIYVDNRRP